VTLAVLTLQFIPIEHRQRVIRNAYRNTVPGGALIVVEKVLGAASELDDLFTARYLAQKAANGYTSEEIDRKRAALEGVLVPVTARANEEMLRAEGWGPVDCFWRWVNFVGWIAIR
jgi:tRNA (cmo5U34)-methyltransferase